MVTTNQILTKEEREVLVLAAVHPNLRHLNINEIGQRLGMTTTTVKTHIHQACVKLGADNRNEAVLLAMQRKEISLDELISVDELAEILSSVEPDVLRRIALLVQQCGLKKALPETHEAIPCLERKQNGKLTNRERDVLILSSHGLTNGEIAEKLCMTTSAVRTFLNRAFTKLGARKKADAIQLALKQGEISVGELSSLDELANYLAPLGADNIEKLANLLVQRPGKESALIES
jgi:DNA-binding NarL/FixJ family response regulator